MSHFKEKLVTEFHSGCKWRLVKDVEWVSDLSVKGIYIFDSKINSEKKIVYKAAAPIDTDLASIPRFLWWLVSPWDIARAAVLHDSMYQKMRSHRESLSEHPNGQLLWDKQDRKRHRKKADVIFFHSMKDCKPKPSFFLRYLCYLAVRLMGWRYV